MVTVAVCLSYSSGTVVITHHCQSQQLQVRLGAAAVPISVITIIMISIISCAFSIISLSNTCMSLDNTTTRLQLYERKLGDWLTSSTRNEIRWHNFAAHHVPPVTAATAVIGWQQEIIIRLSTASVARQNDKNALCTRCTKMNFWVFRSIERMTHLVTYTHTWFQWRAWNDIPSSTLGQITYTPKLYNYNCACTTPQNNYHGRAPPQSKS